MDLAPNLDISEKYFITNFANGRIARIDHLIRVICVIRVIRDFKIRS